ncbi:unnamed protein product [Closterium sp. NIES-54]
MMEKFFSFMSFYEQHQQEAPAQSNNSDNNKKATPMSLDGSSYARGNQQQPTFAPYEPQRGSISFAPHPQSSPGQEKTLGALQSEGLGFESQCVLFGHPSAGWCQRSTGDPQLILGKGYRHVGLGGYGRIDPLLNKPFYPNDPLPPPVPAPSGVSQVDAVAPVEVTGDSGAAAGAEPWGADSGGTVRGGAEPGGATSGGAGPEGATAEGAEPGGAGSGGAVPGDAGSGGAGSGAAEPWGATSGGAGSGAAEPGVSPTTASRREPLSPQELREWFARRWRRAAESGGAAGAGVGASSTVEGAGAAGPGAAGPAGPPGAGAAEGVGSEPTAVGPPAGGVGGPGTVAEGAGAVPAESGAAARPRPYFVPLLQQVLGLSPPVEGPPPVQSQSLLEPSSPLPAPSPYTGPTGGLAERREPASRPASPVRAARASGRSSRQRPPPVPGTHRMSLRPSTAALRAPLPSLPESSLPALADPESDSLRAARPTVPRLLATVVTDPSFESAAASALVDSPTC